MKKLILPIYIILNIIYVVIASYLNITNLLSYNKFSKSYIVFLILNIVIILLFLIIKKEKMSLSIIDIFLICIIFFSIISVIFAIKIDVALFGVDGRYEGLFQILYYFSLYFLSTYIEKKYKKIVVYFIILFGLLELVYAVFQILKIDGVIRMYHKGKIWATGFTTNPCFFSAYMLLCICYSIGLFIDSKISLINFINIFLIFLFMIGLLISNAMSGIVGLIIVLTYLIIYCIKNKKYKKVVSIFMLLTISVLLISCSNLTTLIKDIKMTSFEVEEISKGNINDKYGTRRIYIWKNTLKIVPKNIINGVGIDNFYYAFGDQPLSKNSFFYDKAHNEYLQILICEGIFAFISYLLFYGFIVIVGIKNSFKNNEIYLILPVIGYLVQAFFNISVIEVAPFFYISLGLLVDRKNNCNFRLLNNS